MKCAKKTSDDKPFCHWQTKCKEDTKRGQWTCTANLAEGHAFRCPNKSLKDAKKAPGRCEDAEPPRSDKPVSVPKKCKAFNEVPYSSRGPGPIVWKKEPCSAMAMDGKDHCWIHLANANAMNPPFFGFYRCTSPSLVKDGVFFACSPRRECKARGCKEPTWLHLNIMGEKK